MLRGGVIEGIWPWNKHEKSMTLKVLIIQNYASVGQQNALQNHRTVWIRRDLKDYLVPTPVL